jgi:hypothetical protein
MIDMIIEIIMINMIMRIYYQLIVLYCNVFMYQVYLMQKYLNTL